MTREVSQNSDVRPSHPGPVGATPWDTPTNPAPNISAAVRAGCPVQSRAIVVLGVHRGGTSAVTRALMEFGVDLGADLMPGVEGINPDGFWENPGIYHRNEHLLRHLGRAWNSVDDIESSQWLHPLVPSLRADTARHLAATFRGSPVWAFKDPRTARLLPFWKAVLSDVGVAPSYLIAVRNPLSVAASLAQRDGMPLDHALILWLEHMVEAVLGTAGALRCFVDYDKLVDSPAEQVERIGRELHLAGAVPARGM